MPRARTWRVRGDRAPHPDTERRLRDALQTIQLLMHADSAAMVRARLVGTSPELDDQAPAVVLADHPVRMLRAARTFLGHGRARPNHQRPLAGFLSAWKCSGAHRSA